MGFFRRDQDARIDALARAVEKLAADHSSSVESRSNGVATALESFFAKGIAAYADLFDRVAEQQRATLDAIEARERTNKEHREAMRAARAERSQRTAASMERDGRGRLVRRRVSLAGDDKCPVCRDGGHGVGASADEIAIHVAEQHVANGRGN